MYSNLSLPRSFAFNYLCLLLSSLFFKHKEEKKREKRTLSKGLSCRHQSVLAPCPCRKALSRSPSPEDTKPYFFFHLFFFFFLSFSVKVLSISARRRMSLGDAQKYWFLEFYEARDNGFGRGRSCLRCFPLFHPAKANSLESLSNGSRRHRFRTRTRRALPPPHPLVQLKAKCADSNAAPGGRGLVA